MGDGSRWYTPFWEGLFDGKHVAQMGQAIWLYGWIVCHAHVAQRGGLLSYQHIEAATALGRTERTIRSWFRTLEQNRYLEIRARHPYHLEVQVTKWRAVDEWLSARNEQRDRKVSSRPEERPEERPEKSCHPLISIRLSSYSYPTGAPGAHRVSLADLFSDLCARMDAANGRGQVALLVQVYELCFGEVADPEQKKQLYGYIGKVKNRAGGAKRLAQLMWELTPRPPAEPLGYISKMLGAQARYKGAGSRVNGQDGTADEFADLAERQLARLEEGR